MSIQFETTARKLLGDFEDSVVAYKREIANVPSTNRTVAALTAASQADQVELLERLKSAENYPRGYSFGDRVAAERAALRKGAK